MSHFINTLQQIAHSDSVGMGRGTCRHLRWQIRRLLNQFPCELPIGSSRLYVERPGGVAALVNAMGTYDYNNMSLLQAMLRHEGGTFVDVGANIGSYTLLASEIEEASVISIEPHPKTFALLTENVRRNARNNVTCLNVAVSATEGWCSFTDGEDLCVNRIARDDEAQPLRVATETLQSICEQAKKWPDFLKIDVEGYELPVLESLGRLSSSAKIIWIEAGERKPILEWVQQAGYSGPWYVHYKKRTLSPVPAVRAEDPVFLGRDSMQELSAIGFEVEGAVESKLHKAGERVAD